MTTFYNETSSNGKFQVMSASELTGKGIKKYGSNCILEHKNEIFKNLNNYWVSKNALTEIKENFTTERACF